MTSLKSAVVISIAAAIATATIVSAIIWALRPGQQTAGGEPVTIRSVEWLGPEFVRVTWSNGARYVGAPNTEVRMAAVCNDDKRGGGSGAIAVSSGAEIHSQQDTEAAAASYQAAGRSPQRDRQAILTAPAAPVPTWSSEDGEPPVQFSAATREHLCTTP